jgi:hypothetical protein
MIFLLTNELKNTENTPVELLRQLIDISKLDNAARVNFVC